MRPVAFALVVIVLSGCGSGSAGTAGSVSAREWASGASQILDGLDEALARVANAGVGRVTLENTSTLYEALLGYTYLGGCTELLTQLGEPTPRLGETRARLRAACHHLGHASNVFTRAVQLGSARLLVAAAREALGTAPLLRRARELLGRGG